MALSLKSNLAGYYEEFGTNTGPPPALDKKGDYMPIFNLASKYGIRVTRASVQSPMKARSIDPMSYSRTVLNTWWGLVPPSQNFFSNTRYPAPGINKDGGAKGFTTKIESNKSQYFLEGASGGDLIGDGTAQQYEHRTQNPGYSYSNLVNLGGGETLGALPIFDNSSKLHLSIPGGTSPYGPVKINFTKGSRFGPNGRNTSDNTRSNLYNFYTTPGSPTPLTTLYGQSPYYGDLLNFRDPNVTTNWYSWGLPTDQPFVLRGIQRVDNKKKEPQLWGHFLPLGESPLALMLQGGAMTRVERIKAAAVRTGKFIISPKGLEFTLKKFGLGIPSGKGGLGGSINLLSGGMDDRYSTMDYFQLHKGIKVVEGEDGGTTSSGRDYNDFRDKAFRKRKIPKDGDDVKTPFMGNPDIAQYIRNNPITRYGMGDSGRIANINRSDYTKDSGLGDRINAALVNETPTEVRDYVKFQFKDIDGTSNLMAFRATFETLTDTFNPDWSSTKYMGRPDSVHVYSGYSRDIAFDFKVYADCRKNMKSMWQKLNMLTSYTTPDFDSKGRATSPIMKLTLGDYIVDQPGFLNTLVFTSDSAHPWEITAGRYESKEVPGTDKSPVPITTIEYEPEEDMFQLPMVVSVNVSYTIINQKLPKKGGWFFGNEIAEPESKELGTEFTRKPGLSLGRQWLTV